VEQNELHLEGPPESKLVLSEGKMRKRILVTIFGSFAYGAVVFLIHNLLVNRSPKVIEIFLANVAVPFALGFIISLLIKHRTSWLFGSISYVLYFICFHLYVWLLQFGVLGLKDHLINMVIAYLYIGIFATVFTILGGILSYHFLKNRNPR